MHLLYLLVYSLGPAMLSGGPVSAQPSAPLAIGDLGSLLLNRSVQEELKLTPEQTDKVDAVVRSVRARALENLKKQVEFGQAEEGKKFPLQLRRVIAEETLNALKDVLPSEKVQRLKEINFQRRGFEAYTDPKVQEELRLSPEQRDQIQDFQDEAAKEVDQALHMTKGDPQEMNKKVAAAEMKGLDQSLALLTSDQKKTWAQMTGAPMDPNKSVPDQLNLNAQQRVKVKEAVQKVQSQHQDDLKKYQRLSQWTWSQQIAGGLMEAMSAETMKALATVLQPEQFQRLKEVDLQIRGLYSLANPEVQDALKLTDVQKEQVQSLIEEAMQRQKEFSQKAGSNLSEIQKQRSELRHQYLERGVALLTSHQKKTWARMIGEPADLTKDPLEQVSLTTDQKEEVQKAIKKVSEKFQDDVKEFRLAQDKLRLRTTQELRKIINEETWAALKNVLDSEQILRLRQIDLQVHGGESFTDPKVQEALKLTPQQRDKIHDIRRDAAISQSKIIKEASDPREVPQKLNELYKQVLGKLTALLTPDQIKTWKEILGDTFELRTEKTQPGKALVTPESDDKDP